MISRAAVTQQTGLLPLHGREVRLLERGPDLYRFPFTKSGGEGGINIRRLCFAINNGKFLL